MRSVREITLISSFVAILVGGQLALSWATGVEVVTVLFVTFSYHFGVRRSLAVATAFSLLRCLLFGFFPNVLILYLIHYNLFAVIFGALGRIFRYNVNVKIHLWLIGLSIFMAVCFTLFDDIITPLFYQYTSEATIAYFFSSLYAMIPQTICSAVTVAVLGRPLLKAYEIVKMK
ncbi:MAG: hypothetical protein IKM44_02720 [Clostridia bacterium]|nr:hypothetical protein [Clostridia bacterium]